MSTLRKKSSPQHPGVAVLTPRDAFRVNPEPILRLRAALGAQAANDALRAAEEDLAHRLDRILRLFQDGAQEDIARDARVISDAGRAMGLSDLALAAEHVMDCAGKPDGAAFAATIGRLLRSGQAALDHFDLMRANPR